MYFSETSKSFCCTRLFLNWPSSDINWHNSSETVKNLYFGGVGLYKIFEIRSERDEEKMIKDKLSFHLPALLSNVDKTESRVADPTHFIIKVVMRRGCKGQINSISKLTKQTSTSIFTNPPASGHDLLAITCHPMMIMMMIIMIDWEILPDEFSDQASAVHVAVGGHAVKEIFSLSLPLSWMLVCAC